VDPRAGLDDVEKRKFFTLQGLELRLLGRPTRSQSVYRLRYRGSYCRECRRAIITVPVRNSEIYFLNSNCLGFQSYLYYVIHYFLRPNCGKDNKICPQRIGCVWYQFRNCVHLFLLHVLVLQAAFIAELHYV
jgi:hypothetical protein